MRTIERGRLLSPLHVRRLTPDSPVIGGPMTLCGVDAKRVDVCARPLDPSIVERNARGFCARCLRAYRSEVTSAK